MKKKIIGSILFLMLLIPSISSIKLQDDPADFSYNQTEIEDSINVFLYPAAGFLGVNVDIENSGESLVNDVKWSFRSKPAITGTGIFISTQVQTGIVDEIKPGETITLQFLPFNADLKSPIGLGNVYINFSAGPIRTQQRAFNLGFFLLNFKDTYMDITPDEAYQRLQNDEFDLIIDVVGLDIYNNGHLPGAVNYVWADGTLNSKIDELDPSLTYLVYCHTDPPSTASAQALVDAGFKTVYRLEGNYAAWKNAGYPIET